MQCGNAAHRASGGQRTKSMKAPLEVAGGNGKLRLASAPGRRLVWTLAVAVWALSSLVVAIFVPKHLPLMIMYGVVGLLYSTLLLSTRLEAPPMRLWQQLLILLVVFVPLSNSWFPRIWRDLVLNPQLHPYLSPGLPEVCVALTGAMAVLTLIIRKRMPKLAAPVLLTSAGCCFVAGAVLSTAASTFRETAIGNTIVGILAPVGFFISVSAFRRDLTFLRAVIVGAAVGALVPLTMGVFSVLRTFGFPHKISDLLWIKMNIQTYGDYGVATFGNSGHMASFVVLILPLYGLLLSSPGENKKVRTVAATGLALSLGNLILTYSRAGLIVGCILIVALAALSFLLSLPGKWFLAGGAAVVFIVSMHPVTMQSYVDLSRSVRDLTSNPERTPLPDPAKGMSGSTKVGTQQPLPRDSISNPSGAAVLSAGTSGAVGSPNPLTKGQTDSHTLVTGKVSIFWKVVLRAQSILTESREIERSQIKNLSQGRFTDRQEDLLQGKWDIPLTHPKDLSDLGVTDLSGQERFLAFIRGIILSKRYGFYGSGLGTYPFLDPRFTSAHNLPLQIWVEGGILALIGLLLILIHVVIISGKIFVQILLQRSYSTKQGIALAGALACTAFLVHGTLAGDNLILGYFTVWGFLFSFCLALSLAASVSRRP